MGFPLFESNGVCAPVRVISQKLTHGESLWDRVQWRDRKRRPLQSQGCPLLLTPIDGNSALFLSPLSLHFPPFSLVLQTKNSHPEGSTLALISPEGPVDIYLAIGADDR